MKTYLPIVFGNELIRRGIVLFARHGLGYSVEHVTLTTSIKQGLVPLLEISFIALTRLKRSCGAAVEMDVT